MKRGFSLLSVVLRVILLAVSGSGCSSSVNVTATRFTGIVLDSLMTIRVGDINGPYGFLFREDLIEALLSTGAFNLQSVGAPFETTGGAGRLVTSGLHILGEYHQRVAEKTVEKYDAEDESQFFLERRFYVVFDYEIYDGLSGDLVIDGSVEDSLTEWEEMEDGSILESIAHSIIKGFMDSLVPELFSTDKYRDLRDDIANRFVHEISAREVVVDVKLLTDGGLPELERGVALARDQKWREAIVVFQTVIDKYPGNEKLHKAYFDLGVAYEYDFQFDLAWQNLQNALASEDEDDYHRELQACRRFEQEYRWRQRYLKRLNGLNQ